jgi:recombination protein RecT
MSESKEIQQAQSTGVKTISQFLQSKSVIDKFSTILGEKSIGFVNAVLTIVNQSDKLQNATKDSIYTAALMAASLDIMINPNFGFAYIVPYWNEKTKTQEAQFQMGWKGFVQLAQRTGLYKNISASAILEGQIISNNPLFGYEFDFNIKSDKVVGYASYFRLLNGFEKVFYMSMEDIQKHAKKYSQTYKSNKDWVVNQSRWSQDFDSMALKTVIKLLISKFGPMSIEMQKAIISDQSVIKNIDTMEVDYVDNTPLSIEQTNVNSERNSLINFINKCTDEDGLSILEVEIDKNDDELVTIFETKKKEILNNQLEKQENGNAK